MPTVKTDVFDPADVALAARLKALAHPARLGILRTLAERDTCLCGDLVEVLPLAQATVSQHLRALREAGLIQGETDGPRSCYCLDADALRRVHETVEALFGGLDCRCDCCG
ncbi:MAG: metalloregulator ArsR/SmtB family transcription factor [Bacteroidota bacterium]